MSLRDAGLHNNRNFNFGFRNSEENFMNPSYPSLNHESKDDKNYNNTGEFLSDNNQDVCLSWHPYTSKLAYSQGHCIQIYNIKFN